MRNRYRDLCDPFSRFSAERADAAYWVDPHGGRREKGEYPYSYSEFFLFGGPAPECGNGVSANYSDRLWQWDHDKATAAAKPINGRISQWSRDDCSRFLTAYYGEPIVALALAEGCNISNGYPYWIFWYRREKKEDGDV